MRLKKLIEGVTPDILFHTTRLKNALNILKEDRFVLSNSFFGGKDVDFQKEGKYFYLSTSRNRYSGYVQTYGRHGSVTFNLNGRKLGSNYESLPANFFGDQRHEGEERIINEDPVIENATKYIEEAHVFIDPEKLNSKQEEYLNFLLDYSEKKNIPIFVYKNKSDWATQNKKEAFDATELELEEFPMFIYPKEYEPSDEMRKFIEGKVDEKIQSMDREEFLEYKSSLIDHMRSVFKVEPRNNDLKRKLARRMERYEVDTVHELLEKIYEEGK